LAKLKPEHYKAIELFEEGTLSIKEIAAACGIPTDSIYDLMEGDTRNLGDVASLFKAEIDKVTVRSSAKIRVLVKDNKKLALMEMNDYLRSLRAKKGKKTAADKREIDRVVRITNSLAKSTPGVEIGSFSYTQGLSAEDLVHEFNRLNSIARHALDGGAISSPRARRQGKLPGAPSTGNRISQES